MRVCLRLRARKEFGLAFGIFLGSLLGNALPNPLFPFVCSLRILVKQACKERPRESNCVVPDSYQKQPSQTNRDYVQK